MPNNSGNYSYGYLKYQFENRNDAGKFLWWLFCHFLLFPRIPFDFFLYWVDREKYITTTQKLYKVIYVITCIVCFVIVGSYIKAKYISCIEEYFDIPGMGFFPIWILLSTSINIMTLFIIELFAMTYKESANELELLISQKISDLQKDLEININRVSEGILGHKMWAGPETHKLFIGLSAGESGNRAKWFIVNFLSHLANDRIQIENQLSGDLYSISTGKNDWPISHYSKFLAKNMDHAEHEILWLVDPDDFFGILLPEFISYVLAAHVVCTFNKIPEIFFNDLGAHSLDSIFSIYKVLPVNKNGNSAEWARVYKQSITDKNCNVFLNLNDIGHADETWEQFHNLILNSMISLGAESIKQFDLLPEDDILSGFEQITQKYLDGLLPHLMAFRNADNGVFRKRILFLGCDMPNEEFAFKLWVDQKIEELWTKNIDKWSPILKTVTYSNKKIIHLALKLFIFTCGGEETLSIYGKTESPKPPETVAQTPRVAWDIGLYDSQFVVSAEETNVNPPRRKVEWYYGNQKKDKSDKENLNSWQSMLPQKIQDALVLLNEARTRNGNGMSFGDFKNTLMTYVNTLS